MISPFTPPPELVQQWWIEETYDVNTMYLSRPAFGVELLNLATKAACWGWEQRGAANEAELQKAADQELEACCEWVRGWYGSGCGELINGLRADRRPKPPSLKEQALRELGDVYNDEKIDDHVYDTIRRALEALPND